MNELAIFRDPIFKKHVNSPSHPESPARLSALDRAVDSHELKNMIIDMPCRAAELEEIARVHAQSHIDLVADSVFMVTDEVTIETRHAACLPASVLRQPHNCICPDDRGPQGRHYRRRPRRQRDNRL